MPSNDLEPLSADARNNVQCNILRSNHKLRSRQFFVRVANGPELLDWLKRVPYVTNVAGDPAGKPAVNLLVTAKGLEKLGILADYRAKLDESFVTGVRDTSTSRRLRDTASSSWGAHATHWDAAVLVASDENVPADFV